MERGHPEARKNGADEDQEIVRGDTDERYPRSPDYYAERHQRRQRRPVRKETG